MNTPTTPLPNGTNGGRGPGGRFAKGNSGGPGNPYAARVAKLRSVLLDNVSEADMKEITETLKQEAKGGNLPAIKELLERVLGKPFEADLLERLEQLEEQLAEAIKRDGGVR